MNRVCFLIALSALLWSSSIVAQDITGNMEGRVVDKEGNAIAGVPVSVSSASLQGIRSTETDEKGRFKIVLLPPGLYRANIHHLAYHQLVIDSLRIRLGKTTYVGELRLEDKVVEMKEVVVTRQRSLIDPTSTTTGGNFSKDEIESLPLQRGYESIPLLLPQVNQSYFGDGISYSGSSGLENGYIIDGVDVGNPMTNNIGTSLPYNFIQEVEVKTGGYEAEYRSSLGGIVNAITPSGGDRISGQIFGFYTNKVFFADAATLPFEPPKGTFSSYDFGLTLGGPVVKEKLWFNAAYNPSFESEEILIPGIGYSPQTRTTHHFAWTLSWQYSEKIRLILNTIGDPYRSNVVYGGEGLTFDNSDAALSKDKGGGFTSSLKGSFFLTDHFVLDASISRVAELYNSEPSTVLGTQPSFIDHSTGTISGGIGGGINDSGTKVRSTITATLTVGNHVLKSGLEYLDNTLSSQTHFSGFWKYSDSSYIAIFDNHSGTVGVRIPSAFVQDSWDVSSQWHINAGIRWDGQYIVNSDGNVSQKILGQFQPRVGLIFSPKDDGTQKFFASYGRFYQQLSTAVLAFFYLKDLRTYVPAYDHDPRSDPTGADTLFLFVGHFQEEIANLKGEYTDEFSLGYENEISREFRISTRGIYRTLGSGLEDAYSSQRQELILGNPGFGPLAEFPAMNRYYLAWELSFQKTSNDPLSYGISYVLSRTFGNYTGLFNADTKASIPNFTQFADLPELLSKADGLLPYDRTHVFKFFGSYRFDFGLSAGTFFSWSSGTPLSEFGGVVGGGYSRFIRQRGTLGRTPSIWDLNLRIAYKLPTPLAFGLDSRVIVDVYHVASSRDPVDFDQVHYFSVDDNGNQIDPNPNYGKATLFLPPMSLRLGLEVDF